MITPVTSVDNSEIARARWPNQTLSQKMIWCRRSKEGGLTVFVILKIESGWQHWMTLLLQASTGEPTKRHHLLLDEDVKEGAPTSQSEQGWDHGRDWPGCVACPPQVCQACKNIFQSTVFSGGGRASGRVFGNNFCAISFSFWQSHSPTGPKLLRQTKAISSKNLNIPSQ